MVDAIAWDKIIKLENLTWKELGSKFLPHALQRTREISGWSGLL